MDPLTRRPTTASAITDNSMLDSGTGAVESDKKYVERWQASTRQAIGKLSRAEQKQLKQVKSITEAQDRLKALEDPQPSAPDVESLLSIKIAMDCVHEFEALSRDTLDLLIDTSAIWGFFGLMFEYQTKRKHGLADLASAFTDVCKRVDDLTAFCRTLSSAALLRDVAFDAHVQLLCFGEILLGQLCKPDSKEFQTGLCVAVYSRIDDIIARAERRTRWASQSEEIERLRKLLQLTPVSSIEDTTRACVMLPPAKNARFYDRDDTISTIDSYFHGDGQEPGFRLYGLYGLGGVGKSHIALKYAEKKMEHFKNILWIHSETQEALEQSFTNISLRLQLKGANRTQHEQNRIEVLNWLHEAPSTWLLVYDNVVDIDLFWKYRPAACRGCAIVTTRSQTLADRIAEARSEVLHFDKPHGSRLLTYLLSEEVAADIEGRDSASALELSERLSGHALAISSIAALIRLRAWTIDEFLLRYDRNPQRVEDAVGTVWKLSFESLNARSSNVLAVLAYIMPDDIPEELFEADTADAFPPSLEFCTDDWDLLQVVDDLKDHALIRRDKETKRFSIHRLVQSQFRYFLLGMKAGGNQEAFNDTAKLLFERFPKVNSQGQLFDRVQACQLYSQHVSSLKNHFKTAFNTKNAFVSTTLFCKLLENYRRYLLESTSFEELEDTLRVSRMAFDTLDDVEKSPALLSKILQSTSLMWAHRGYFSRCESDMREAYNIRCSLPDVDQSELAWSNTDLGNIISAVGHNEEALELHHKALKLRVDEGSGDLPPLGIAYQNLARSYFMIGDYNEAEKWADQATEYLSRSDRWVMVAYTRFVLGNVYRAERRYAAARAQYNSALSLWVDHKNTPTHHFRGACLYKLGCVELEMGHIHAAISSLEDAHTIARLHQKVMPGDYARIIHKLAEAQRADIERLFPDKATYQREAERLLAMGRPECDIPEDLTGEKAYDRLVYVLWR